MRGVRVVRPGVRIGSDSVARVTEVPLDLWVGVSPPTFDECSAQVEVRNHMACILADAVIAEPVDAALVEERKQFYRFWSERARAWAVLNERMWRSGIIAGLPAPILDA